MWDKNQLRVITFLKVKPKKFKHTGWVEGVKALIAEKKLFVSLLSSLVGNNLKKEFLHGLLSILIFNLFYISFGQFTSK